MNNKGENMTSRELFDVYAQARDKFSQKFKKQISKLDKSTPPDQQENSKTAEQIYNDLVDFGKKYPNFQLIDGKRWAYTRFSFTTCIQFHENYYYNSGVGLTVNFYLKRKTADVISSIGKTIIINTPHYVEVNIENRVSIIYHILDLMISNFEEIKQVKDLCQNYLDEYNNERIKQENERTKKERIKNITEKSIEEWVKKTMQDSGYTYKIVTEKNKSLLVIKITGKQQLEIPLYDKSFQKIVPKILDTIKPYEELIKKSEIKVLIGNVSPFNNMNWIKS